MQQSIHERLLHPFRPWLLAHDFEALDPWIEVRPDGLPEIGRYLRDERDLAMNMLHCITAVDYFEPDAKKAAQVDWQPHLELIYHLSSIDAPASAGAQGAAAALAGRPAGRVARGPSVSGVWSTAEWHEREVFDLMGVYFLGHPDPRRILCPEDWVGHPLRKDYRDAGRVSRNSRRDKTDVARERVQTETVEFDVRTDEMLINMGPQHPSTHGVLRLVLRTDGEVVTEVDAAHRLSAPLRPRRSPRTSRRASSCPTPTGWIIWPA